MNPILSDSFIYYFAPKQRTRPGTYRSRPGTKLSNFMSEPEVQ